MRLWGTAVDNHRSHIVDHYSYLSAASKKVKELHEGTKTKFGLLDTELKTARSLQDSGQAGIAVMLNRIVRDLKDKLKEIEDKFTRANDFPTLVAREVKKRHAAFALVRSEVSRVHVTVEQEKMELKAVKGAVEQIVQTLEQWDQHSTQYIVSQGPAAHPSQELDSRRAESADHSLTAGLPTATGGTQPTAPQASAWDPWRASAAAATTASRVPMAHV